MPITAPPPAPSVRIDLATPPSFQIVIKSFRRFVCLRHLVRSILTRYPTADIIVADDSFADDQTVPDIVTELQNIPNVTWLQLPFNVGLTVGRNRAIETATADIIIMCDDDFVFTDETRIENFLAVLKHNPHIDLIAGLVRMDAQSATNWSCILDYQPGQPLQALPLNTQWTLTHHVRHRQTELALNWYAIRRPQLLAVPWDEQFKITMEHIDHFLLMKQAGVRIEYTPDCIVGHEPRSPQNYGKFRMHDVTGYIEKLKQKWDIPGALNFTMHPEPGVPNIQPVKNRSIVVFGVGHSGTTITTRLLETLGWNTHNADCEFRENIYVRKLNDQLLTTGELPLGVALKEFAYMEQAGTPWVVKDPRFLHTIDDWMPVLRRYEPILVHVTRNLDALERSFRKRNPNLNADTPVKTRGLTLPEADALARHHYDRWPWAKVQISLEQIAAAAGLVDVARAGRSPMSD